MKRFPSIKKNDDFKTVYTKGNSQANSLLVMYVLKKEDSENRIGISASKKIGNSVTRHRMCRLVRESFRLNDDKLKKGYDIVVVIRKPAVQCGYDSICEAYMNLCKRHGILI